MNEENKMSDETSILKCIMFDQDAFLDLRRTAAEQRQREWEKSYLAEIAECSRTDLIYSRSNSESISTTLQEHDRDIIDKLYVDSIALVGSSQDGLYLEKGFAVIESDRPGEVNETDVDILCEFHGVEIHNKLPEKIDLSCLIIEESLFPGYVLLRIGSDDIKNPIYFDPMALKRQLLITLDNANFYITPSLLPDCPSLGGAIEDELGIHFIDFVPALRMKAWPHTAEPFICRERRHGWPTDSLLKAIKSKGCGFVAVGHSLSPKSHLEWRVSFSSVERMLIYSLTSVQIRAYLFFKTIFKLFLAEDEVVTSYMMKNIFFWVLEENPSEFWSEDNMLECVESMIDKLTYCLEICYIPNFILPDRNLLSTRDKNLVEKMHKKCYNIQGDVLGTIIKCTESKEFKGLCIVNISKLLRFKLEGQTHVRSTSIVFSVIYYLLYVHIRLLSRRYQINFTINTLEACANKRCASIFQFVPPRAVWYIINAILYYPDQSKIRFYKENNNFVFDISAIRESATKIIWNEMYTGNMKKVVADQELAKRKLVPVLPQYRTLLDWVDTSSQWNGGKALKIEKIPIEFRKYTLD